MKTPRFMERALLVLALLVGSPGVVRANADDDFFDYCATLWQGDKCHTCGADWYGFPSHCAAMLDINVRKVNQQCLTDTCISSGKVTADVERQLKYVDSHNAVWVTYWGGNFGSFDPWFGDGPMKRYKVAASLQSSVVQMSMLRRSGDLVYSSPKAWIAPPGYDYLKGVGVFSNNRTRSWANTVPYRIVEQLHGRSNVKNRATGDILHPTWLLGSIDAMVGGYYNNVITLNVVYVTP